MLCQQVIYYRNYGQVSRLICSAIGYHCTATYGLPFLPLYSKAYILEQKQTKEMRVVCIRSTIYVLKRQSLSSKGKLCFSRKIVSKKTQRRQWNDGGEGCERVPGTAGVGSRRPGAGRSGAALAPPRSALRLPPAARVQRPGPGRLPEAGAALQLSPRVGAARRDRGEGPGTRCCPRPRATRGPRCRPVPAGREHRRGAQALWGEPSRLRASVPCICSCFFTRTGKIPLACVPWECHESVPRLKDSLFDRGC